MGTKTWILSVLLAYLYYAASTKKAGIGSDTGLSNFGVPTGIRTPVLTVKG